MSSKITTYDIEIMPNGKWRNKYPSYIVFNDHIKDGLHECPDCKCSFCQEPSIVTILVATHKTDGRSCGLMYCKDCALIEYKKLNPQTSFVEKGTALSNPDAEKGTALSNPDAEKQNPQTSFVAGGRNPQ